jgi:endonuclease YncB( thermonuclease family)
MRSITTVAGLLCCGFAAGLVASESAPQRGLTTEVIIVDVYDGDTVVVQPMLPAMRIRLLDCWAPEIRTRDAAEKVAGYESRDHLRTMLKDGDRVMLHIPTTDKLQDSLTMGRVLGTLWADTDGNGELDNVSTRMVESGHATRNKQND